MENWEKFTKERARLTEQALEFGNTNMKRFFNLDWNTYKEGSLPVKMKELMGLVASMVLRCDDCISYHLIQCKKEGVSDDELGEAMNIALIVGGSIVIPHLRRGIDFWKEIPEEIVNETLS